MSEPLDLGPAQYRLGRTPGFQIFFGPLLVLWGVINIVVRGIDSVYGIIGLMMVFVGAMLVLVNLGATVNIHPRGLTVRSSFFRTTQVPWSEVKELLPASGSFSSFRIVRHDDSMIGVDRLSLEPQFNRKGEQEPHKDVQLVLRNFKEWQAANRR